MKKVLTFASVALLMGHPALAQSPLETASDTWEVCNETSFILRMALATEINRKLTPRGWTKVRPGACYSVPNPGISTRYVYAESSPAHLGGIREWKGTVPLCAASEDFVADTAMGCILQNLETRLYIPVDPKEPHTQLVEPEDFKANAETAGLQRLLKDNGYDISRIDGRAGRRTTRSLRKFLTDNGLATDIATEAQFTALETKALEYSKVVGLTLCNESSAKIWAAIGKRRNDTWESRGWWPIQPEDCVQAVKETLKDTDIHVFARQEVPVEVPEGEEQDEASTAKPDRTLRVVATTPSQFCISDARFSALGRENCTDNGYQAANFRELPTDKDGTTVTFTDADFVELSATGLRR